MEEDSRGKGKKRKNSSQSSQKGGLPKKTKPAGDSLSIPPASTERLSGQDGQLSSATGAPPMEDPRAHVLESEGHRQAQERGEAQPRSSVMRASEEGPVVQQVLTMEHSEQLKDPSVDTDEQFQRGLKVKSLASLFNLRLKTEQPSNVLQERLHFSDRDPPLLVLCISRHSEKPTRYGHQLANALTANFQSFVEGSICIIPVLVEHDKSDTWNTAAQAALETAKRTFPDSRLIMTAAKCRGIERAAFIALGLGAYFAAQRELNQFSEKKIHVILSDTNISMTFGPFYDNLYLK